MVGGGDVARETRQVAESQRSSCGRWRSGAARGADDGFLADLADFQTVNEIYAEVLERERARPEPVFRWHRCRGGTGGSTAWPGLVMI